GSRVELNGSNQSFVLPSAVSSAPSPVASSTNANRPPTGYLDSVTGGVVEGWAADPDRPTQAIQVVVVVDGADVATIAANQPRPDVTTVFPQFTGNHGVVYALPVKFQDGLQHRLRLFAIDDNGTRVELNASNVFFVAGAAGQQTAPTQTTTQAPAPTSTPSAGTVSVPAGQVIPVGQWVERPNPT